MIKIFDSLTHPTIKGEWFERPFHNTFENLSDDFEKWNFLGGCAVALPNMSDYDHATYYLAAEKFGFFPVASFNFNCNDYEAEITKIIDIGYSAIKIHPRLSGINISTHFNQLEQAFILCEKYNVTIFYCTYYHAQLNLIPEENQLSILIRLLKKAPQVRIILLHGGDVELMRYCQLARFNHNILIDLSYTLLKFKGSSLEQDFIYLFNSFEKKICIGSDFPDFSIQQLRERFDQLSELVHDKSKLKYIASENIMSFLKIG